MESNKSKAELLAENRFLRKDRNSSNIATVLIYAIKYGALVAIFYFGYLSVLALAGKHTLADIGISFLSDVNVSVSIAWIFGVSGIFYGLRQRKVRKDTIERLQGRIQYLEAQIDSKRTTSQLTSRGDTREEDKL